MILDYVYVLRFWLHFLWYYFRGISITLSSLIGSQLNQDIINLFTTKNVFNNVYLLVWVPSKMVEKGILEE